MTDTDLLVDLGARIKSIRMASNMTQNQLAINCNFEKSSMSKIESGQVNVSYLTLNRISIGLGVPIRELFPDGRSNDGKFDGKFSSDGNGSDRKATEGKFDGQK